MPDTNFDVIPELPEGLEFSWWNLLKNMKSALEKLITYFDRVDDDWIYPQLGDGWEYYGGSWQPPSYRKDPNNMIILAGLMKNGGIGSSYTVFNLPVGYRPGALRMFTTPCATAGYASRMYIYPTGDVRVLAGHASYTSLDGIMFRAEK
jgi:hypothetical protein